MYRCWRVPSDLDKSYAASPSVGWPEELTQLQFVWWKPFYHPEKEVWSHAPCDHAASFAQYLNVNVPQVSKNCRKSGNSIRLWPLLYYHFICNQIYLYTYWLSRAAKCGAFAQSANPPKTTERLATTATPEWLHVWIQYIQNKILKEGYGRVRVISFCTSYHTTDDLSAMALLVIFLGEI